MPLSEHPAINAVINNGLLLLLIGLVLTVFVGRRQKKTSKYLDNSVMLTPSREQESPSGRYILRWRPLDEERMAFAVVSAGDGATLTESDPLKRTETFDLLWGADDDIWLYRKENGLRYWKKEEEKWSEKPYSHGPSSPAPPRLLLQMYPELYI